MTLWAHQIEAMVLIERAWLDGFRAPLLVLPTGTGKTRVMAATAAALVLSGASVRFLVHRYELIDQTKAALEREGVVDGAVEIITPDRALRLSGKSIVDYLFVDECHHYVSREWGKIVKAHAGRVLGATATPERSDGRAMGDAFDKLIAPLSVKEAIVRGILVQPTVFAPVVDDDAKSQRAGLAMHPHEALEKYKGRWSRAIVFCSNIDHAIATSDKCNAAGLRSDVVHGRLEIDARSHVLDRFTRGELDVVTNVFVLTEGYDDAPVDCCVLARGVSSPGAYLQMVGRAIRSAPGKTSATIVDLAGSVYDSRIGLPDAEREYSLEGVAIRELGERILIRQCLACGAVYEAGPAKCERCGYALPPPPKPKISRRSMAEVNSAAYVAAHAPNPREAFYRQLQRTQIDKGYKPGYAKFQFKLRYGYWPKFKDEVTT